MKMGSLSAYEDSDVSAIPGGNAGVITIMVYLLICNVLIAW